MTTPCPPRKPGRPRDAATDRRILDAAFSQMAQHGYARMSVDAVAAEAGVTKPTIYRRYRGKVDLALAALAAYRERDAPADAHETRAALIVQLHHFRVGVGRPYGMTMLGTALAEEFDTPDLLAGFREYLVEPRRAAFRRVLIRARERGELADGADIDLTVNMLVGAYYAQYLEARPFDADWETRAVDAVLSGILRDPRNALPIRPT